MPDNRASEPRAKSVHRRQLIAAVSRLLKAEYNNALPPLSDRLSDLLRKIEQAPNPPVQTG